MAPAGWHPDPADPTGSLRWWDGTRWTKHVEPAASGPGDPSYGPGRWSNGPGRWNNSPGGAP